MHNRAALAQTKLMKGNIEIHSCALGPPIGHVVCSTGSSSLCLCALFIGTSSGPASCFEDELLMSDPWTPLTTCVNTSCAESQLHDRSAYILFSRDNMKVIHISHFMKDFETQQLFLWTSQGICRARWTLKLCISPSSLISVLSPLEFVENFTASLRASSLLFWTFFLSLRQEIFLYFRWFSALVQLGKISHLFTQSSLPFLLWLRFFFHWKSQIFSPIFLPDFWGNAIPSAH